MASVSSCSRCRARHSRAPRAARRGPRGRRRRRARASRCEAVPRRPQQRVDLGVLGLHRLAASRRSSVVPRSSSGGQRPASSPEWCWCSASAKSSQRWLPAAARCCRSPTGVRCGRRRRSAARSRRKAWCITYIIVMSTGPSGAAVWPGRRSWARPGWLAVVVLVRAHRVLPRWSSVVVVTRRPACGRRGGRRARRGRSASTRTVGRTRSSQAGHPPVPAAEQRHGGRDQDHPDDGRVEEDRDGHADAEHA